jgi:hypothetical protein
MEDIKAKMIKWLKSPKNIYFIILLTAITILSIVNNNFLALLIFIGFFCAYGVILGLIYLLKNKILKK